jgi:hypothetical protein
VLAFMRTPLVRRLRALRVAFNLRDDRSFVRGFIESEIQRLELDTWSYIFDITVERDNGAPRTRISVRYDTYAQNRVATVPSLRARAATWPRELVDVAIVEIDPRYPPDERAQILAATEAFAAELEVTETPK